MYICIFFSLGQIKFGSDNLDAQDDETGPVSSGSIPVPVPSAAASTVAAAAAVAATATSSASSQSTESRHTQGKALRCLNLLCDSTVLAPFLLQLMTAK